MKLKQIVYGLLKRKLKKEPMARPRQKSFQGQLIARKYCLYAVMIFTLQGLVAVLGASDLIFPKLPSPIPFEYGRAIHLSFAVTWPLIGTLGIAYYFVIEDLQAEIFSLKLIRWQVWLVLLSTLGLYTTLALRLGNGREYLDGLPIFYIGISLSLALSVYNMVRTVFANKQKITPPVAIVTAGIILLLILLIPNVIAFRNPVADEAVKFWVVHLWEELAFELTTSGFIASFFITSKIAEQKQIVRWLYLEATLSVSGGLFGTGHHYYWIGYPAFWLILGVVFSLIQVTPVFMLVHLVYKGLKNKHPLNRREKMTLWLLLSSLFHHVTGASLLGLMITVPWINLYVHGTYITSAHAHLALFGTMGFLVLSGIYYILSKNVLIKRKQYLWGIGAVIILNIGLIIMSFALLIAGFKQAYIWRYLGSEFLTAQAEVKPFLMLRVLGGGIFMVGDFLLGWQFIVNLWWKTFKQRLKK